MNDFEQRQRAATSRCTDTVFWRRSRPSETLAALAQACEDLGVETWDHYGSTGAVAQLEAEVADLLGKPAAVFLPSGIMAQQAVLRVWCDTMGSRRVALPDLSHLIGHEADGPRLVHDLRLEFLTTGRAVATAGDLEAIPGLLGAALVEMPLRDAGCLLPTWDELVALSESAHERGVPLHLDGARMWESQPFYDRPLAEIAGLFDSVYVSFYKGLGAMAGACVAADSDVVEELRLWRKRMGGTLFAMTPYAVGALVGLREEVPRMGEYLATARRMAEALSARGLTVHPQEPHICTFEVYADGVAADVNERLVAFMERTGLQLSSPWRDTDVPGKIVNELACYAAATTHDPDQVAGWFLEVLRG